MALLWLSFLLLLPHLLLHPPSRPLCIPHLLRHPPILPLLLLLLSLLLLPLLRGLM